jgi:hypothetical protein
MQGADTLRIEILADGTLKTTTDPVSAANHSNAEQFLKRIDELAGGAVEIKAREGARHHHHEHHAHGGEHVRH